MSDVKKIATRESYGRTLVELGKENDKIVVLDADLAESTKTGVFKKAFPERHFDCGIAEADMIGIAAGFAILALPDLALIIAYFNQRIYYTDEMFVHKNFWGIKRLYRYEDITGIRIDGDVNLFLGKRKVRIYDRAVGKNLFAVRERDTVVYMIKVFRWCREKRTVYSTAT